MMRYCDSAILIYYLDSIGPLNIRATNWLRSVHASGDQLVVSDLTRLECRVKPLRLRHAAALAAFDSFFAQADVRVAPLTSAVLDRATDVRALHNFTTTDSIHLAAAIESGCDRFLTNDFRLHSFTSIPVEIMP
jgi:predicted nucleic acid-binding protein